MSLSLPQRLQLDPDAALMEYSINAAVGNTIPAQSRENRQTINQDEAADGGNTLIVHDPVWVALHDTDLATWESYMRDSLHAGAGGGELLTLPGMQAMLDPMTHGRE